MSYFAILVCLSSTKVEVDVIGVVFFVNQHGSNYSYEF